MITELDGPPRLAGIGHRDVNRLQDNLYRWANRPPELGVARADDEIVLFRGAGPRIPITDGYEAFKNAYCCAEDSLKAKITPLLEGTENRIILQLKDTEPETIQHYWTILSKVTKP